MCWSIEVFFFFFRIELNGTTVHDDKVNNDCMQTEVPYDVKGKGVIVIRYYILFGQNEETRLSRRAKRPGSKNFRLQCTSSGRSPNVKAEGLREKKVFHVLQLSLSRDQLVIEE